MGKAAWLGLALAALPLVPAQAAPATQDEAARLEALFERYVGVPAPGAPSSVTVTPSGDSYRVTLDLKLALKGLESFGVTVDPNVSATMLTPLPDGTWKVASTESPPIVVHVRDQSISLKAASTTFDGVYDPRMFSFKTVNALYTGYDYAQVAPTLVQNRHTDKVAFTFNGAPADGGTVTGSGRYDSTGIKADMLMRAPSEPPSAATGPAAAPAMPATPISYAAATSAVGFAMDRLHAKELLDVWAFLVAHPNHDSLAAAQDGLRAVLRAALPFVAGFRQTGSLDDIVVTTPVGVFSSKSLEGAADVAGLDGTTTITTGLTIADLVVPADQLPPWSKGLVPTALSLNLGAEGFHVTEAAAEAVDDFDLKAEKPFTPDQTAKIGRLAMPEPAVVKLLPSSLTSELIALKLEGQATLGDVPDGRLTVRATGLDKAIATLQAASNTDPSAAQALGPLVLAKNLAKTEADGSLSWLIELKGSGPVTVNGAPLQ